MSKQNQNNDITVQLPALRTVTPLEQIFLLRSLIFAIILTIAREVNIQGFNSLQMLLVLQGHKF